VGETPPLKKGEERSGGGFAFVSFRLVSSSPWRYASCCAAAILQQRPHHLAQAIVLVGGYVVKLINGDQSSMV